MRATLSLGRWFGIPVGANAGVLVILALVGLGLGAWQLPLLYPGRAPAAYAAAGAAGGLLLVLSILIHELAHAVLAKANGIQVERIVLWLLGGVAQLRGEARSPGVDLSVAVVGPLTSLALAVVFGVGAGGWNAVVGDGLVSATLGYLAVINVLLAVFNLVPAAPLDGGRVLRAALWWGLGDRVRAAVVAARSGRFFGLTLIVLGGAGALLWGWLGGLWLALIGFFLVHAAMAEEQGVLVSHRLRGVLVRDVMSAPAATALPTVNVARFIEEVLLRERYSAYPLVDPDGRLTGLVTLNRVRQVPVDRRAHTTLRDVACPADEVPTARPDEPLVDLLPRLDGSGDGRAVVVDEYGRVAGIVSPRDVARTAAVMELRQEGAGLTRGSEPAGSDPTYQRPLM